jgi:HlyD family secretion protein
VVALLVVLLSAGGGAYWWKQHHAQLPPGVFSGNGRLEADEIDIDTKYAGRIVEMFADEGTMVKAGQVLARMDTRNIEASLKGPGSLGAEAVDEANANVAQQASLSQLAQQQMDRAAYHPRLAALVTSAKAKGPHRQRADPQNC